MPIPLDELARNLLPRVLSPATTVGELLHLLAAQPEPRRVYVVVRLAADAYDVLTLSELAAFAPQSGGSFAALRLGTVPGLLLPAPPVRQTAMGLARAQREQAARPRRRLVVLDDHDAVVGVLAAVAMGVGRGDGLLDQLDTLPAPAHISVRFDGRAPNQPLVVARLYQLRVAVGDPDSAHASRPFDFDFGAGAEPVAFSVAVHADPTTCMVQAVEPTLVVAPPGRTTQEARFSLVATQVGREKVLVTVARADTGATVQHLWLPLEVASDETTAAPAATTQPLIRLPLDAPSLVPPDVELVLQSDGEAFRAVVRRRGANAVAYRLPTNAAAVQNAALRLRQELQRLVPQTVGYVTLNADAVRDAYLPLADAGWKVWDLLFNAPRASAELGQLAADLRALPAGSSIRIVLDTQSFIVPWALLYDKPGPLTRDTLAWDGFWGYRYALEVLPPGDYPTPQIAAPPGLALLLNDDAELRQYTTEQERVARTELTGAQSHVAWGQAAALQMLASPPPVALLYAYCHGEHASAATSPGALPSDSALRFGGSARATIADLRRLPVGDLAERPLVFLNTCQGATQEGLFYDGFMPFFVEQHGARGLIGTEVQAPIVLAHDYALRFLRAFASGEPVGKTLWRLRQHYLDTHHNILAFNYSLYCLGEVRLATPLVSPEQTDA